ncbi:MAG: hypothetical protein WCA79_05835 [Anaerolineales bacterium]
MKPQDTLFDLLLKEWLLVASAVGLIVTSIYLNRLPTYSVAEFQILFLLAVLFIAVKGLEQSGLILQLSQTSKREIHSAKVDCCHLLFVDACNE